LAARLTIAQTGLRVDFDGTSGCSAKGINVPLNYAAAYTVFALRCLIGPDIPNNAGSLGCFHVTGPPGCILNAQPPAPVAMRHTLGQMTPDLVYGCLAQAVPDLVPAEGASTLYDIPVRHTPSATHHFAVEFVHNGGTGARPTKDGLSATAFPSGVWGTQTEMAEQAAPVLIHRRELRTDSGGAGRFRGGLGQRIKMSPAGKEGYLAFLSVERIRFPAQGRDGGQAGAPGRIRIGEDGADLPSKGEWRIDPGQTLIFETPGGGGHGDPRDRDRKAVDLDLEDGLISPEAARDIYGLDP
jgi:N-methylhydantoinase B